MIKITIISFIIYSFMYGQDINPREIMERSYTLKKPMTSIMEIRVEIMRKKGRKEKVKIREFTRYEKIYNSGKYRSKTVARFTKPKIVKGTGLLSWVERSGATQQWVFLPKLKSAKKIKAKEKSKSFLNTDFIYEDLENRNPVLDSLAYIGTDFIDGDQCTVIMAWPKSSSNYFSRKIWTNNATYQVCKIEFYKNESVLEKTLILSDFVEINGFTTPGRMVMRKENGNKTEMKINSFKPDIGLKDEIFSQSFLIKL